MAKNNKKHAKSKVAKPVLKKKPAASIKAKQAAKPSSVKKAPVPARHAKPSRPAPQKAAPVARAVKAVKISPTMEKPSKKNALRNSILKRKAPAKPIAFSLDEVRAIAKTVVPKPGAEEKPAKTT